jgi:hypothetical protein
LNSAQIIITKSVRLLEFQETSERKVDSCLARWSISDLLLDLFFPETTSSIKDLIRNPRVDFYFLEEIFLRPQATSRILVPSATPGWTSSSLYFI